MGTRVNYTLVGLFVIVLGAALVGVVAWLTAATETKQYDEYLVYTNESVAGLNVNASVNYKGVQMGQVVDIELDHNNPDLVKLTLKIERGTPIRQDTTAKLVSRGITGIVNVELSGGGQSPPLVPTPSQPLPVIKNAPSLVAQVEDAFNNMYVRMDILLSEKNLAAISQTLANIQTVTTALAGNSSRIDQTLINLENLTGTLAASSASLNKVLAGANSTLDNSARLSSELRTELKPVLAQTKTTLAAAETMTRAITETSQRVGRTVNDSGFEIQQLARKTTPEFNLLLAQLNRLTDTMERFVKSVERNPRMFLFGKPTNSPGPGE
jgi:phospholipid/cholesterol/gamma-HCH transport system substrate-binding protein